MNSSTVERECSGTIEAVQEQLDKFLLAVFEAARGRDDVQQKAADIKSAYLGMLESVELLRGINSTFADQELRLRELSSSCALKRSAILTAEQQLMELQENIDLQLGQVCF